MVENDATELSAVQTFVGGADFILTLRDDQNVFSRGANAYG